MPPAEVSNRRTRKKLSPAKPVSGPQVKGGIKAVKVAASFPSHAARKGSKRTLKTDTSPPKSDGSTPKLLPDCSGSGDEYRILRRKYLFLEEESFSLGRELMESEAEVKVLEDEKHSLLDHLVVLEGLMDPSELKT